MEEGATINADATVSGNGGKVVLWSNDVTWFDGQISVKGGSQGGNGGFVETSQSHHVGCDRECRCFCTQGDSRGMAAKIRIPLRFKMVMVLLTAT